MNSLRSMAVLSSRAQERRRHEKFAREARDPPQSPRGFSALARLYYLVRPTKTAMLRRLMDEKIKTWTLRFPATDNPNMEKALFDWPVVLQYDVKAKYRLISRKLFGHEVFQPSFRLTNQKPRAFVSVR